MLAAGRQRRRSRRTAGRWPSEIDPGCAWLLSQRRDHGDDGLREILIKTSNAISTCQGDSPPDRRKPALFLATGTQYLPNQPDDGSRGRGMARSPRATDFDRRRVRRSRSAGRGRAGPDEDLCDVERASTGRTAFTAAVLDEDVASSRRAVGRRRSRCAGVRRDRLGDDAARGPDRVRAGAGRALDRPRLRRGRRTRRVAIAGDRGEEREVGRVRAGRGGALARSALPPSRGRWPTPLVSSRSPRQLLPTAVQRAPRFTASRRAT